MALLLVQHGKSLSKEVDPEQGLSEEGRAETGKMASSARKHGVWIARIEQSGKTRAAQTAEIFASALQPADGVRKVDGLSPLDNKVDVVSKDWMKLKDRRPGAFNGPKPLTYHVLPNSVIVGRYFAESSFLGYSKTVLECGITERCLINKG
jgi:broad specificity phosphatase PhoE